MTKRRLDVLLVDRGLAESREKAQALVMAGQVRVDERPAMKAGVLVPEDVALDVEQSARYVSRGGEKLEHALRTFGARRDGARRGRYRRFDRRVHGLPAAARRIRVYTRLTWGARSSITGCAATLGWW